MKKTLARIGAVAASAAMLVVPFASAVAASPSAWNVTGHYTTTFVLGGDYTHDMNLTQDASGAITAGTGGYPAGGPYTYTWHVTSGSVAGDQINLTAVYDTGAPGVVMHMTGTIASDGTMSGTWDDNYGGGTRNGTWHTATGTAVQLVAQDFGVVSYDTGLGMLKGYSAGFGLTNATLPDIQSVVVQLYASTTLLQTNTGTAKINTLTGSQFSSPFDVSGSFDYTTDGYWTNVRATQYGQSVPATRVVATVTLKSGAVLTAENSVVAGDPTTIYPVVTPPTTPTDKDQCKKGGWMTLVDSQGHQFKNQGDCVSFVATKGKNKADDHHVETHAKAHHHSDSDKGEKGDDND